VALQGINDVVNAVDWESEVEGGGWRVEGGGWMRSAKRPADAAAVEGEDSVVRRDYTCAAVGGDGSARGEVLRAVGSAVSELRRLFAVVWCSANLTSSTRRRLATRGQTHDPPCGSK
jgi:hypothetical protein